MSNTHTAVKQTDNQNKTHKVVKRINDTPYIEENPDKHVKARIAIYLPVDVPLDEGEQLMAEFKTKHEAVMAADAHNKMVDIIEK